MAFFFTDSTLVHDFTNCAQIVNTIAIMHEPITSLREPSEALYFLSKVFRDRLFLDFSAEIKVLS